jgi:uncharacterized membrane protein
MRTTTPNETIVVAFPAEQDAHAALAALRQLQATGRTRVWRAAVIARDAAGALDISETNDISPTKKGLIITLTALGGFLIGLLWRGVRFGAVLGAAAGQSGAIVASVIDLGYGDLYLNELASGVRPGRSGLVATVTPPASDITPQIVEQFPGATIIASAPVTREGLPAARPHTQPALSMPSGAS